MAAASPPGSVNHSYAAVGRRCCIARGLRPPHTLSSLHMKSLSTRYNNNNNNNNNNNYNQIFTVAFVKIIKFD